MCRTHQAHDQQKQRICYPLGDQCDKQFKNQNWPYDIYILHRKLFDIPFNQMCKQEDDIFQKTSCNTRQCRPIQHHLNKVSTIIVVKPSKFT